MSQSRDEMEKLLWKQKYNEVMQQLQAQAAELANNQAVSHQSNLSKARQRFHQAGDQLIKLTQREYYHTMGTESIMATILGFRESLRAIGQLKLGVESILFQKFRSLLHQVGVDQAVLSLVAQVQGNVEYQLSSGRFKDGIAPAIIPYMANVGPDGVLEFEMLDNPQLSDQPELRPADPVTGVPERMLSDRDFFKEKYQPAVNAAIIRGLKAARSDTGEPLFDVDDSDPNRLTVHDHGTRNPVTQENFAAFRDTVLTAALKQEFDMEFRAEPPCP